VTSYWDTKCGRCTSEKEVIFVSGFFFGSKKRKEEEEDKESIEPEKIDEKSKKESAAFTTTTKSASNSKSGNFFNELTTGNVNETLNTKDLKQFQLKIPKSLKF
jgi:hypothetical protein